MKITNQYLTSDFYLVAYLLSSGMKLLGTQGTNPRKMIFVLEDLPERRELVQNFYSNRALVNPLVYKNWIMNLKALLYSQEAQEK